MEGSRLGLCSEAVSIRAGRLPVHVEFTARFGDRLASLSQAVFCAGLTSSETDVPGSLPDGAAGRIALAGAKESGRGRAGAAEVRKGQLQGRGSQSEENQAGTTEGMGPGAVTFDLEDWALLWETRHGVGTGGRKRTAVACYRGTSHPGSICLGRSITVLPESS